MRCPYCNEEMESGYIKSSQFMRWGKNKKLGYLPEDIKLVKDFWGGFLTGFFVESCYCKNCRKIVVSLDEIRTSE